MRSAVLLPLVVAALTACTPATPTAAPVTPSPTPSVRPTLQSDQRTRVLTAIRAVEPGLAQDEAFAVAAAQDLCDDIAQGKPARELANNARVRFTGPTGRLVTVKQADGILAAVRSTLCPASTPSGGSAAATAAPTAATAPTG